MPMIKKQLPKNLKAKTLTSNAKSAWDVADTLKILLYGQSGSGKTTLWATFPGPILALICSGGSRPGELKSINTKEYRDKIDARIVTSVEQISSLLDDASNFATVVLDHVTGLQDLTLKEVLGLEELPAQKSWGMASREDYGQSTLQCKEVLRALLSLESNVAIIGQERRDNMEGEVSSEIQAPTVGVAASPSLAGWLNPAVDYICQTFKRPVMITTKREVKFGTPPKVKTKIIEEVTRGKGVEYCLRTAPHDVFTTKFRVPKGSPMPEVIVDADYAKLMKVIQGIKA